ncbi:MAG: DUF1295 domain-containing protein [Clostridia bacterium]|nr:DUF1295 domain-containing protein [Clostridia bacterium]
MNLLCIRKWSLLIVGVIYLLATALGIFLFNFLNFDFWLNILLADIGATILVFIFSLIFNNASVYDPYWSVQPIVILVAVAIKYSLNLSGIIILIVVSLWGIRLTANWIYTFKDFSYQDWRYLMLKEKTKVIYPIINFIGIHLVPTLVVYACVMPAVFIMINKPNLNWWFLVCVCLSVFAFSMQGIADFQMHKFRKSNVGKLIETGLWKYSRHPNYLGEILTWWGVGLGAFSLMPDKYYLLVGAVLNTILFLSVSLPMAEKRQSNKDGYAEYKSRTRLLFPIKKPLFKSAK